MLLIRDDKAQAALAEQIRVHTSVLHRVYSGEIDVQALQHEKLLATLDDAGRSALYRDLLAGRTFGPSAAAAGAGAELDRLLRELPLLEKSELSRRGAAAFTREMPQFLHYYESSGTTGDPLAAPKALDDLAFNTINIGEMWGRFIGPGDTGLILINAPFAPAAYQFEKVLEYLGVMSLRPWVDNITGDYTRVLRLTEQLNAGVFIGPPSRLLEMVQFAGRNGLRTPRFKSLLLMAEQTGPSFLSHLERLTGATAYVASYGSSETGTIAVTCEQRNLHAQTQSYVLELETDHGVVRVDGGEPQRGKLVVTTLDLPARPLLRYQTGDLVEMRTGSCACGLRLPILRTLGRAKDRLVLENNGITQEDLETALWSEPLETGTVFNYMLVVQGKSVVFLVTADQEQGPWTEAIAERLHPLFEGYQLVVRQVDKLPPLASLGQYLGWKLSRVLDLGEAKAWDRLPEPIRALVRTTLDEVGASPND